jgi:glycosyltransferase involved in cell wall biosynthesis
VTPSGHPPVTVIVRAKNEAASIEQTLQAVAAQTVPAELVVVDSGSTDGTREIARAHGARVIRIPAATFTFGGSLNRGAQEASGQILVALSAHAHPTDRRWLERLVGAFSDPRVACAAGTDRGPDGEPLTGLMLQDEALAARRPEWGYSSAAGAFRADLWRRRPFRADMPGTEDKEWAWHWLRQGWLVAIDPGFDVAHDHSKDSVREQFERARREWVGYGRFIDVPAPRVRATVAEWWSQRDTYRSSARARLSHRRAARLAGRHAGQRIASRMRRDALRIVVMADAYPVLSETFVSTEVEELRRAGHEVSVEAITRPDAAGPRDQVPVRYMVDEGPARKLADTAWLVGRHPVRCLRDVRDRRAWAREEEVRPLRALAGRARRAAEERVDHLHVHFANESALEALRIGRILGLPYSVTAHAYDIFLTPRNLAAKLEEAAFVTTGCEYNARHLRRLVSDPGQVHVVVMGVDADRFRRDRPLPGGRSVIAVGRLIEKKGFDVLIEAAAALRARDTVDRVVIVGDGPLREHLEARSREVGGDVEFTGAATADQIRQRLQEADLLAMPCVVAPDGDRDSMPVVCKEALAMELPVVASDEVGLPELVHPEWGRLTPPGDAEALAGAIEEILTLPGGDREAMGRAGRDWVTAHCNARTETAKVVELIRSRVTGPAAGH